VCASAQAKCRHTASSEAFQPRDGGQWLVQGSTGLAGHNYGGGLTGAWTASQVEGTEPGLVLGERQALEAWLDFHRDTLLLKCAGLTAGQLKERAVPPSQLSLLGLVRHMTEVERWWFRMHAANATQPYPYDPDQTGQDFGALDEADAAANIEAFKQEIERARAAVAGKHLDDARHNGHADLIRERIDGVTGD
jgi:Protein of unknown function (DUF664)